MVLFGQLWLGSGSDTSARGFWSCICNGILSNIADLKFVSYSAFQKNRSYGKT